MYIEWISTGQPTESVFNDASAAQWQSGQSGTIKKDYLQTADRILFNPVALERTN